MKNFKLNMIIILILLIVLVAGILLMKKSITTDKIHEFKLSSYSGYIEKFPGNESVGEVADGNKAKEIAEDIWVKKYSQSIKAEKKPYLVFYDYYQNVWLVKGSLPKGSIGGVPYILIRKSDGKILAVWHDK